MNCSDNAESNSESATDRTDAGVVLAREAGVPFHLPLGEASGVDPFTEWLSLMEVVQMLCLEWPVRDKPMQGNIWRL
jgi:hypothetical protein